MNDGTFGVFSWSIRLTLLIENIPCVRNYDTRFALIYEFLIRYMIELFKKAAIFQPIIV
jgi:hypothetical protein